MDEYEAALPAGGWPNWVLSNHDRPRIATRVGPEQARLAAMLLLTLRGTPTIYYGDEIELSQVALTPEQVRDPLEHNIPGLGIGRDGARTPMQWDCSAHAGFSRYAPWLPLAPDHRNENVASQRHHETSILNLYRRLIAARRGMPVLSVGSMPWLPRKAICCCSCANMTMIESWSRSISVAMQQRSNLVRMSSMARSSCLPAGIGTTSPFAAASICGPGRGFGGCAGARLVVP